MRHYDSRSGHLGLHKTDDYAPATMGLGGYPGKGEIVGSCRVLEPSAVRLG